MFEVTVCSNTSTVCHCTDRTFYEIKIDFITPQEIADSI